MNPATSPVASPAWLDSQYNNRARVPEAVQHLQRWAADSATARVLGFALVFAGLGPLSASCDDADGLADVASEPALAESVVSACATPVPATTAAPTPSAHARPPTRPT